MRKHKPDELSKNIFDVCNDNVKDIDQLVAALDLEYNDNFLRTKPINPASVAAKSPQSELNKLESWFEKAAAEAVMYHSQNNLIGDDGDDADEDDSKNERSHYRKKTGPRRPSTIRRGRTDPRIKEDKKSVQQRREYFEPYDRQRMNSLARSTPNLIDHDVLNNADVTVRNNREITKLEFTENNLKDSPEENKQFRKISLEDNLARFPKIPLFYMPSDEDLHKVADEKIKDIIKHTYFESEVFYTESKNNDSNHSSPTTTRMHEDGGHESVMQTKRSNAELEELNKLRPKSMFTQNYFEKHFLYDVKSLWASTGGAPDNVRNSLTLDTGIQTDDNGNFCQSKIVNNPHSTSTCNVTPNTVNQEKSLWEKFKNKQSK